MNWQRVEHWLDAAAARLIGRVDREDGLAILPESRLERRTEPIVIRPAPVVLVTPEGQPGAAGPLVIGPVSVVRIDPQPRPIWDDLGWERRLSGPETIYEGYYTANGSRDTVRFRGRVVERGGKVSVYIADPPAAIKRHPKGPCFQLTEPPWFKVHWRRPATNPDDAILYVQRILHEVYT